jgi:hypothetical protein
MFQPMANRLSEGMYEIRHNGVARSYRDVKSVAYDAARCGKARCSGEIVEIVDLETGLKVVVLEDGRTA